MSDVMIFGGTTEGRLLSEYCVRHRIAAVVCVVSDYGEQVLPKGPLLRVVTGALGEAAIQALLREERPALVLDATHPYAAVVTGYLVRACREIPYVRIGRKESEAHTAGAGQNLIWAADVPAAVQLLEDTTGSVFVTTGSKELCEFTRLKAYEERVFARVLPSKAVLELCEQIGISGKHILAMQGPYSREMNAAMLRQVGAAYMVTKESGSLGGFSEKLEAAAECGVCTIVIGRPKKPEGISVQEGMQLLTQFASDLEKKRVVNLIGIGMGGSRQLTLESLEQLKQSDVILGAPRMLESIRETVPGIPTESCYLSTEVVNWLELHPQYTRVSVVYSGDTGFYSGAASLLLELRNSGRINQNQVTVFPGISSVSYLCARLGTTWEDAFLVSRHGRNSDVLTQIQAHPKIFFLLGGKNTAEELCHILTKGGYGGAEVTVGEKLSYPEERIVTGTAEELMEQKFDTLAVVLVRSEVNR
ncbi:MAG: precorrin-6A reductase [Hungatella sp.]